MLQCSVLELDDTEMSTRDLKDVKKELKELVKSISLEVKRRKYEKNLL